LATRLYIGGLSFDTTEDGLRTFFEQAGTVESAMVATDRYSGRSRGFGFVEMASGEEAQKAIDELNGKSLDGRTLTVAEARPREDRGAGGGGGRGGFRGGGGGGGRGGGGGGGGGDRGGRGGPRPRW
jgi:cold-inducible RNA-binding protein